MIRFFNRTLATLLCAVMLFIAVGMTPARAEKDLWETAFEVLEEKTGLTEDAFIQNQLASSSDGSFSFSVELKEHSEESNGLYIATVEADGTVSYWEEPSDIPWFEQLQTDIYACYRNDNCYELLYKCKQKWEPILATMTEEEIGDPLYANVIWLPLSLPDEDALTYDQALAAAKEALLTVDGWTEEKTEMYVMTINAFYTPDDIGNTVWFFYFEKHSQFEDAYSSDKAIEAYWAKLDEMFDGNPPLRFSLTIDAADGTLVEKPVFDYAPVQYHYLDFLIRTEAIQEAAKGE